MFPPRRIPPSRKICVGILLPWQLTLTRFEKLDGEKKCKTDTEKISKLNFFPCVNLATNFL